MQPFNSSGAHSGGEKNETRMRRRPICKLNFDTLSKRPSYYCTSPRITLIPDAKLTVLYLKLNSHLFACLIDIYLV